MDNTANSLDSVLDPIILSLDVEKNLVETQDAQSLMDRLAPQEMDRLANDLYVGLRKGLAQIIGRQIQDGQEQFKILQTAVSEELKDTAEEMEIKDLENKFNVADFTARIYEDLNTQPAPK